MLLLVLARQGTLVNLARLRYQSCEGCFDLLIDQIMRSLILIISRVDRAKGILPRFIWVGCGRACRCALSCADVTLLLRVWLYQGKAGGSR